MDPIEQAVAPLKIDAMDRAEQYARKLIIHVQKKLEENGWNLNKAAPRPASTLRREDYRRQMGTHELFRSLTKATWSTRRPNEPDTREMCAERCENFVKQARENAAAQYDAFVSKLVQKIGPVESAELHGNHVWSFSVLEVHKADGSIERWKTQTIINISKLGKVFNQWPTRKLKK